MFVSFAVPLRQESLTVQKLCAKIPLILIKYTLLCISLRGFCFVIYVQNTAVLKQVVD